MGNDHTSAKRPVNLTIASDIVERCNAGVDNCSADIASLLAADIAPIERRVAAEKIANKRATAAFAALYDSEGSLSEECQDS
jgi:post-segregation antitoxin (ccd killing protein)